MHAHVEDRGRYGVSAKDKVMTLRRPDDIERRLDELAEGYAAFFDVSKDQVLAWFQEALKGEQEPVRRFG